MPAIVEAADITWAPPTANNNWDVNTTQNFAPNGGGSVFFFQGDNVQFDDTATLRTVTLAPSLSPGAVIVDTTLGYEFVGSGSITGSTSLVKNGTGELRIANIPSNGFSGGLTVNKGIVYADHTGTNGDWSPWGTGTVTLNNDSGLRIAALFNTASNPIGYSAIVVNGDNSVELVDASGDRRFITAPLLGAGRLTVKATPGNSLPTATINGNTFSFTGTIRYADNLPTMAARWNSSTPNVMFGGPSVTFDLGASTISLTQRNAGSFLIGQLMGGTKSSLTLHDSSTMTFGQKNIDSTFSGQLLSGATGMFIKAGTQSTFTLTRPLAYAAKTVVNEGTLLLSVKPTVHTAESTNIVRNFSIAGGAVFNLTNNSLVIDLAANPIASDLTAVRLALDESRLFSSETTSATALGYRTNHEPLPNDLQDMNDLGSFWDIGVDSSSILVTLTRKGDTNLDLDVDFDDLWNLAINYGSTTAQWYQGDFNYDGIVDSADLGILGLNWQMTYGGDTMPGGSFEEAVDLISNWGSAVPEPNPLGALGVVVVCLRRRRKPSTPA